LAGKKKKKKIDLAALTMDSIKKGEKKVRLRDSSKGRLGSETEKERGKHAFARISEKEKKKYARRFGARGAGEKK